MPSANAVACSFYHLRYRQSSCCSGIGRRVLTSAGRVLAAGAAPRAVACGESGGEVSRESYAPRLMWSGVAQAALLGRGVAIPLRPPSAVAGRVSFVVERSCTLRERSAVCGERMEKVGGAAQAVGKTRWFRGRPSASGCGRYRCASTLSSSTTMRCRSCSMKSQRRRPFDVGRKKPSTEQGTCS